MQRRPQFLSPEEGLRMKAKFYILTQQLMLGGYPRRLKKEMQADHDRSRQRLQIAKQEIRLPSSILKSRFRHINRAPFYELGDSFNSTETEHGVDDMEHGIDGINFWRMTDAMLRTWTTPDVLILKNLLHTPAVFPWNRPGHIGNEYTQTLLFFLRR